MKLIKTVEGHDIELCIDKIEDHPRCDLYQVYRVVDGVKVPLYKECFSDYDINKLIENGYRWNSYFKSSVEDDMED